MTLTKRDLVVRIAEETNLVQQDVYTVIQKCLDYIAESMARGENVEFRNFGVFELQERKSRIGRNPNKPDQVVTIPPRKVVKFKAGKIMKQMIEEHNSGSSAARETPAMPSSPGSSPAGFTPDPYGGTQ